MKDTPSSINPPTDVHLNSQSENTTGDKTITKDSVTPQQHNDENKNIILLDDDNNQNILSTSINEQTEQTLYQTQTNTNTTTNNDSDSSEMSSSQTEAPLPDWITLNESVLIRPYNTSGIISFIGPTHFSVIFMRF